MPRASRWAVAASVKPSVQIVTAGTPRCSNLTPSCTLHVVQEPQDPTPTITASQVLASSSNRARGARTA
jgi:hypothetical protein